MAEGFLPLSNFYRGGSVEESRRRSVEFLEEMRRRRTVRDFSDRPVPRDTNENCLKTGATAPSGANIQPWRFVCVSDPSVKERIHEEAEKIEQEFYTSEATRKWVEALRALNTDPQKPFLILGTGYPEENAVVPNIRRKPPQEVITFV